MTHAWHDVTPGKHLPGTFTAVIEIPMGSSVKYELDKDTGLLPWTAYCTPRFSTLPTKALFRKPWPRMMIPWMCWSFVKRRSLP